MQKGVPLKRNKALIEFSKDHHFGLLLVWKIREGFKRRVDANRIGKYVVHFFEKNLLPHFNDEEELLFSKLSNDDTMRKQAEEEHVLIKDLVKQLSTEPTKELLEQFGQALDKHIRFEERELFNHLQEKLSSGELEKIGAAMSERQHPEDYLWPDVFWK
jgi:hemerythrin-like domain-containing protein